MYLRNNISVIIPLYNAASFIKKAVESALDQPEVAEVIIIEDASTDNSLEIAKNLAESHERVLLLRHKHNANLGPGISRNVGIANAKFEYLAFLDADDYFLPNRFRAENEIFQNQPQVDGVYGALGFNYYSNDGKAKYKIEGYGDLITLPGVVGFDELCFSIMYVHNNINGQFHLDTLTLKRSVLQGKTELFNNYPMHEDTAFIIQLSINCRLEPGILSQPIAMYGVHDHNRIINNPSEAGSHVKYWNYMLNWSRNSHKGQPFSNLFQAFLLREEVKLSGKLVGFFKLGWYSLINSTFLSKAILFSPACFHVFGKNWGNIFITYKERIQRKFFKGDPYRSIMDDVIYKIRANKQSST